MAAVRRRRLRGGDRRGRQPWQDAADTETVACGESRHACYALTNGAGRTYVGYTVDPARRLRQHNGELSGGARRTSGATWRFLFVVAVEDARFGAHEALSLEWHLKYGRGGDRRGRGARRRRDPVSERIDRLSEALSLPKFARFADRFVVLAADDVVDAAWAALMPTLACCCVLPLQS